MVNRPRLPDRKMGHSVISLRGDLSILAPTPRTARSLLLRYLFFEFRRNTENYGDRENLAGGLDVHLCR